MKNYLNDHLVHRMLWLAVTRPFEFSIVPEQICREEVIDMCLVNTNNAEV
jgi:hypothetical protein